MTLDPSKALGHLGGGLRKELVAEFAKITRNYREGRWEAAELNGGRLCEIVYTILKAHLDGVPYPDKATKPQRFDQACKALESADKTRYSDSARITIPRVLVGLYNLRNRRGVGHVGGEVSANHMDATLVLHISQWVMAELVRLFHDLDVTDATAVVDGLVDRSVPVLWQVGDVTRVLQPGLSLEDQTLLLLYAEYQGQIDKQLAKDLEQDRPGNYRRVLDRLHKKRHIEYDAANGWATISPLGVIEVEARLLTNA